MKIIKGEVDVSNIKRCYTDIKINLICTECKSNMKINLNETYLDHPERGEIIDYNVCCYKCHKWFIIPLKIISTEMEIGYFPNKIKMEE